MLKYSFLIATVGHERLKQALESVYNIKYYHVEVVLVCDNPEFDIENYLKENELYKSNLVLIINEKNIGITKSLNVGVRNCTGDVICRLDDDDRSSPDRIDIIDPMFNVMGMKVVTGESLISTENHEYMQSIPSTSNDIRKVLEGRNALVHSTLNISKDYLLEIGGYDENFKYAQDYELYLRILYLGGTIEPVNKCLAYRYENIGSITVSKRNIQALFSLSALCSYHARVNGYGLHVVTKITLGYLRFLLPPRIRKFIRFFRGMVRR